MHGLTVPLIVVAWPADSHADAKGETAYAARVAFASEMRGTITPSTAPSDRALMALLGPLTSAIQELTDKLSVDRLPADQTAPPPRMGPPNDASPWAATSHRAERFPRPRRVPSHGQAAR